ncbi:MAG: manganese efflux pump [Oscillospiraceae bacterium]|nr:manganese efflux pump [Oscillospiraceae bacterium]
MNGAIGFLINSLLLGAGLAMDAFSVSVANGLQDPQMQRKRRCLIAGTFALFQFLMPLAGWAVVRTAVHLFHSFEPYVPWIALILLVLIGGKMLLDGLRGGEQEEGACLGIGTLLLQGIATSIDALSVGFTIAEYGTGAAFVCASLIAAVTFAICTAGIWIGKRFGNRFSGGAAVLGGLILIGIGIEIFLGSR